MCTSGSAVQTNIVHVDGRRSVLMSVFKNGSTSTLDIVSGIKQNAGDHQAFASRTILKIKPIGDQSLFVRASIQGVMREGVIAAALTSLMILLFLGQLALDADRRRPRFRSRFSGRLRLCRRSARRSIS